MVYIAVTLFVLWVVFGVKAAQITLDSSPEARVRMLLGAVSFAAGAYFAGMVLAIAMALKVI